MEENIQFIFDDHQVLIDGMRTLLHTVATFKVVGYSINGTNI
jgi:DNA-binding NarL/FixJ family response regulator